jgi:hypothetical protein
MWRQYGLPLLQTNEQALHNITHTFGSPVYTPASWSKPTCMACVKFNGADITGLLSRRRDENILSIRCYNPLLIYNKLDCTLKIKNVDLIDARTLLKANTNCCVCTLVPVEQIDEHGCALKYKQHIYVYKHTYTHTFNRVALNFGVQFKYSIVYSCAERHTVFSGEIKQTIILHTFSQLDMLLLYFRLRFYIRVAFHRMFGTNIKR